METEGWQAMINGLKQHAHFLPYERLMDDISSWTDEQRVTFIDLFKQTFCPYCGHEWNHAPDTFFKPCNCGRYR